MIGGSDGRVNVRSLVGEIQRLHLESYRTYGSRRVTAALRRKGIICGENRVARLMRLHEIVAKTKRRFKATTNSRHHYPVAPNLLLEGYSLGAVNQIWVADITYIWTAEGWLYLAAILDLYSRRIVGWSLKERLTQELVLAAPPKRGVWSAATTAGIDSSLRSGRAICL